MCCCLNFESKEHLASRTDLIYREWTRDGRNSEEDQIKRIEILLQQFDSANEICKRVVVLRDAKVCAIKWTDPNRKKNTVAGLIKNKLEECGMINLELGEFFTSDIVQKMELLPLVLWITFMSVKIWTQKTVQ